MGVQLGYINDRCPGRAKFFDASRLKVGRQDLPNCLEFMNLKFDWIGEFNVGSTILLILANDTKIVTKDVTYFQYPSNFMTN